MKGRGLLSGMANLCGIPNLEETSSPIEDYAQSAQAFESLKLKACIPIGGSVILQCSTYQLWRFIMAKIRDE